MIYLIILIAYFIFFLLYFYNLIKIIKENNLNFPHYVTLNSPEMQSSGLSI